jgi:hypothetical protein
VTAADRGTPFVSTGLVTARLILLVLAAVVALFAVVATVATRNVGALAGGACSVAFLVALAVAFGAIDERLRVLEAAAAGQ